MVDGSGTPVGYLHLKDVLYAGPGERERPVPNWRVRALAEVSPHQEVEEALAAMQRSGTHLARVVDPGASSGGQVVGVVFLEDILEELVGEVRDVMQRRQGR
jgi:CBS domain containing-hemolysin-like protein